MVFTVIVQFGAGKEAENLRIVEESIGDYPLTGLSQRDESKSAVYIVPDCVMYALEERGVEYELLDDEDLPKRLSDGGFQYYLGLKKMRPEFIDLSRMELPEPGETKIIITSEKEKRTEALSILSKCGFRRTSVEEVTRTAIRSYENGVLGERLEISGFLPEGNFDNLVKELAENKIAGYSRETMILRSVRHKNKPQ